MRFAVNIKEILSNTIVVDNVNSYEEAEDKVKEAKGKGFLIMNYDNSSIETEYKDDTNTYLEIFGDEEFKKLEPYNFGVTYDE